MFTIVYGMNGAGVYTSTKMANKAEKYLLGCQRVDGIRFWDEARTCALNGFNEVCPDYCYYGPLVLNFTVHKKAMKGLANSSLEKHSRVAVECDESKMKFRALHDDELTKGVYYLPDRHVNNFFDK